MGSSKYLQAYSSWITADTFMYTEGMQTVLFQKPVQGASKTQLVGYENYKCCLEAMRRA